MPGTLAIGYDTEVGATGGVLAKYPDHGIEEALDPELGRQALRVIERIHRTSEAPATLFLCGLTLLQSVREISSMLGTELFEVAQHTYSHIPLRDTRWRDKTLIAAPFDLIEFEVNMTQEAISSKLGLRSRGLRTPFGYFEGLTGRPDLHRMLLDAGLEYVSSWGRNSDGLNPTPLEVQPAHYPSLPDGRQLLEIPFQYWLDSHWFRAHGSQSGDRFASGLEAVIDEVAAKDLVFGACFHDWAVIKYAAENSSWISRLIERAIYKEVEIVSYGEFSDRISALKDGVSQQQEEV